MVFANPLPPSQPGSTSAKGEGLRGIASEGPADSFCGSQGRAPIVATLIIKNHRFIPGPRSAVSAAHTPARRASV